MVHVTLQAVTSLWSIQHREHPGRIEVHLRPEEGPQAEDLQIMGGVDDAVPAEADTADETQGALHEGIHGQ